MNGSEYGIDNLSDVNDIVTANSGGFRLFFDANYQNGHRHKRVFIDEETGEIINNENDI